jgi:pilus assembly protein Flp/PilA
MIEKLRNLVWDEEGQGLVEYSLIIALIALAVLVGTQFGLADAIGGIFTKTTTALNEAGN